MELISPSQKEVKTTIILNGLGNNGIRIKCDTDSVHTCTGVTVNCYALHYASFLLYDSNAATR